jgi:hypothetical protein
VFGDNSSGVKIQPDCHANLFEKVHEHGNYADVTGQWIGGRREKQYIIAFQFTVERISKPANAADKREEIICDYACPDIKPPIKISSADCGNQ